MHPQNVHGFLDQIAPPKSPLAGQSATGYIFLLEVSPALPYLGDPCFLTAPASTATPPPNGVTEALHFPPSAVAAFAVVGEGGLSSTRR